MQRLAKNIVMVNRGLTKHETTKNKCAAPKHAKVRTLAQLNSAPGEDLAEAVAKVYLVNLSWSAVRSANTIGTVCSLSYMLCLLTFNIAMVLFHS